MRAPTEHFDAIVVGTGPAGATLAKELTQRNRHVLILEWGRNRPITGTTLNAIPQMAVPGQSLLLTPELCVIARAITVGGSSVFFYATAVDPPVDLFKSYGVDITNEIAETKEELPTAPLPDEWIRPMSSRLMQSARDLGLPWQKLNKFIYADRLTDDRRDDWGWIAAPRYEAKWNARMSVDQATAGGATLIAGAKVRRVIIEGGRATGVEFRKAGRRHKVHANRVILSAGGIGSSVILRASGVKQAGYHFFLDPLVTVVGRVKGFKGPPMIPMSTGCLCESEGFLLTDIYCPWLVFHLNHLARFRFAGIGAQAHTLQIMVKIKDDLGGRLTDTGGVRKRFAENDKWKLGRGRQLAKNILKNAGATEIFGGWTFAAHPGGTVKIGDLVDSDLKTGVDGLYVCDCSVIPEAWGLPPVFTLICLAKRLAKHLAGAGPPHR